MDVGSFTQRPWAWRPVGTEGDRLTKGSRWSPQDMLLPCCPCGAPWGGGVPPALSLCWAVCDAGCTCWSRGEQGAGWPLSLRKPESPTAWEALVDLPPGFKPLPCGAGNKSSSVTRQSRSIFCTQALSQALTAPRAVGPTSKLLHQNPCVKVHFCL